MANEFVLDFTGEQINEKLELIENVILNTPQELEEDQKITARKNIEAASISDVKKIAPYNLLDNSDFTNPVNQRNITNFSSNNSTVSYLIDRWYVSYGNGNDYLFETLQDGIKLSNNYFSENIEFCQKFQRNNYGKFTFAICNTSDEIFIVSGELDYSNSTLYSDSYEWGDLYITYSHYMQELTVVIRIAYNQSISLKWAALYEREYTAETLPEYQPKGYGVELAECLRYFYRYPNYNLVDLYIPFGHGTAADANRVGVIFRFPVPMRIAPTVTWVGDFRLAQNNWGGTCPWVIPKGASERNTDAVVLLADSDIGGLTPGATYILQSRNTTAHIDFSADL